ncbi:hypothetical protein H0H87_002771 [Tephrocybe sp. NHM501043]|nr:hypothetical protein H0H87_002771 [Tephrocybe sp. NHM501043]
MSTDNYAPVFPVPVHRLEDDAWKSGYMLSDDSQEEIYGVLNGLGEALEHHDSEIVRVQATLKQLMEQRKEYVQRISKLKAAVAPHKKLPSEILSKIFKLCSPSPLCISAKPSHSKHDVDNPSSIFSLPMAVCSRWRQIATSSRELWDNVRIVYPPCKTTVESWTTKIEETTSMARTVISRGTRSLFIRVDTPPVALGVSLPEESEPLRKLIIPFSQQLTHIQLMSSMSHLSSFLQSSSPLFPALESLTFCGRDGITLPFHLPTTSPEFIMFKQSPNLKVFKLDLMYLDFVDSLSPDTLYLPWAQLTELSFTNTWIYVETAHSIISRCTSLVTCWFCILFNESAQIVSSSLPMIVHRRLQSLTISSTSGSPNVTACFLQSLMLPSLNSFAITDRHVDDSLPAFTSLITRSKTALHRFSASQAQISASILNPLLELTEDLEDLVIPRATISISMLERMAQGVVLPKLTTMDCTINCSPRSLESFMDAVERVGAENSQAVPLQVASARYPLTERHYKAPRWPQANQRFKKLFEKLQWEGRSISLKD